MKLILSFLSLILIALFVLSSVSCESTGNVGQSAQNFWNSPAVQAELQAIQTQAFDFINAFIHSHLGAVPSSNKVIDACVADLKAKHPGVPDDVLRGAALKAARDSRTP